MASVLALLAVLGLTSAATVLIWRSTRRVSTIGYLKDVTVSREWLMDHQSDD